MMGMMGGVSVPSRTRAMAICDYCGKPFPEMNGWQRFCCHRHQQDWHLRQRRLARQRQLFTKLAARDHCVPPLEVYIKAYEEREAIRQAVREAIAGITEDKINAPVNGGEGKAEKKQRRAHRFFVQRTGMTPEEQQEVLKRFLRRA
jgi:hypothetical protein